MSGPNKEDAMNNVHDARAAVPVAQNNMTSGKDFLEFTVSDTEASDQVPNLAQPFGQKGWLGPGVRVNKDARKVSNHPLGSKVCMEKPLLNRAKIRARNMKFALTRERNVGNRFMINSKDLWTLEERNQLMKALNDHGVFDMKNMCKEVPTKTAEQIVEFLEAAQAVTSNAVNGKPKEKNPSEDLLTPIGQWLYAMEAETSDRKDRFSAFNLMLPKVFLYIAKYGNHPDPSKCGGINYADAYEYVYHMLSGQPGKELLSDTMQLMRRSLLSLSLRARNASYQQLDFIKHVEATPAGLVNSNCCAAQLGPRDSNPSKSPMENAVLQIISHPTANPLKVPQRILEFPADRK